MGLLLVEGYWVLVPQGDHISRGEACGFFMMPEIPVPGTVRAYCTMLNIAAVIRDPDTGQQQFTRVKIPQKTIKRFITKFDKKFKYHLDRYKYYTRYIAENDIKTPEYHREESVRDSLVKL